MSSVTPEAAGPSWCCSRDGARLHYFPRELWVVPSSEAPLGRAAAEPGGTREPLNPGNSRDGEREADAVRATRSALGRLAARREQSEAEWGGGAFSALGAAATGRL